MTSLNDYKKQLHLEEQRRQGLIAKEIDKDTGLEINPYVPVFIAKAPWYLARDEASLSHQRLDSKAEESKDWYQRGLRAGPAATKFRKGACENCGAMSHKTKDCMDRPRKKGAKWTGKDIQADEVVQQVELGFDGKRDRWNGYDSREHMKLVEEFEKVEQKRMEIREQKKREKLARKVKLAESGDTNNNDPYDSDTSSSGLSDEDEAKYGDKIELAGQKVNEMQNSKVTVRNLRIREDTAKYLRNLDVDSAYYDPKTRSMRENPYEGKDPSQVLFT